MARNGGGTYSLPIGNPVAAGNPIDPTWANDTLADIGTEITDSVSRSGKGGMLADLGMGTNKITGLGSPSAATDAATKGYVDAAVFTEATLSSAYTNATNSLTNVTGLSFAVDANSNYEFEGVAFLSTTDETKGIQWGFTGPAAASGFNATAFSSVPSTQAVFALVCTSLGSGAWASSVLATAHAERIVGYLRNGANAGTVQLRAATNQAGATITIAAGSYIRWRKV